MSRYNEGTNGLEVTVRSLLKRIVSLRRNVDEMSEVGFKIPEVSILFFFFE